MFDSLRKKLKSFVKKEEEKIEQIVEKTPESQPVETKLVIPEKIRPKVSIGTKVKKAVARKAEIKEKDISDLLSDFYLDLLESDVAIPVADKIIEDIKTKAVGKQISAKQDIKQVMWSIIKETLDAILKEDTTDLISRVKTKKPFIIMFVGPNGHGKTSTIAKLVNLLKQSNMNCILAAADTFRAASIEQLEEFGKQLNVQVIKHQYGADPAAVCFDAVKAAQARHMDVVLIDTAGRSELNVNLMEQMKKIVRVVNPDLKIYIGEALAGNAAVEEAQKFNEAIDLDGIIMTKVDCDVKGGSILSVSYITGKPILFMTTGQDLSDIQRFSKEWFINKLIA